MCIQYWNNNKKIINVKNKNKTIELIVVYICISWLICYSQAKISTDKPMAVRE